MFDQVYFWLVLCMLDLRHLGVFGILPRGSGLRFPDSLPFQWENLSLSRFYSTCLFFFYFSMCIVPKFKALLIICDVIIVRSGHFMDYRLTE